MIFIQTFFAFIFALSVLIVFHELGHYWMARLCNVKVLRFSLGMGKILYSRKFGPDQTEWALSALPLGGYVKLLDARADDLSQVSPEDRKREFTQPECLAPYCHRCGRAAGQFRAGHRRFDRTLYLRHA